MAGLAWQPFLSPLVIAHPGQQGDISLDRLPGHVEGRPAAVLGLKSRSDTSESLDFFKYFLEVNYLGRRANAARRCRDDGGG